MTSPCSYCTATACASGRAYRLLGLGLSALARASSIRRGCPQRAWLEHYAEHFDTVEVNNTFYRLPKPTAVQGWAEHSPPGFTFAVKVSRYLTHIKRLTMIEAGLKRFYEPLEPLTSSEKLGPLLWQIPAELPPRHERLSARCAALPAGPPRLRVPARELVHDEVYDLLRDHGAALVIGESPRGRSARLVRTADWTYIRFHHGSRGRHGNYSDSELDEWAPPDRAMATRPEIYAYFNNDWEGYAIRNARLLKSSSSSDTAAALPASSARTADRGSRALAPPPSTRAACPGGRFAAG